MTLVDGTQIPAGGAESGLYGTSHSGPWCDFSAEFKLPKSLPGSVQDLYISLVTGNTTLQRFTLHFFTLRTK